MSSGSVDVLGEDDRTLYAFRRNIVIAASAGTGKTHRLTALYVLATVGLTSMGQASDEVVRDPVEPSRIVATTFSRAAANEIRARVEGALRRLASADVDRPFEDVLAHRTSRVGATLGRFDLRERAARALDGWHAARIDTLHGVAAEIVRAHALSLGVSPRARVEEEDEARALVAAVVDEVLARALSAGDERALAARALYASAGGVVGARDHLTTLFGRMDEDGVSVEELERADHLGEARATRAELARLARACAASGGRKIVEPAAALAKILARDPEELALDAEGAAALEAFFAVRYAGEGKSSIAEQELHAWKDRVGKTNPLRTKRLVGLFREAPELAARERGMLALVGEIRRAIADERRERGVLSFGDLLRLARDGMRDDAELARTVRAELDVLMVDEFQDTSAVQRDLVYLLRERERSGREPGSAPTAEGLVGHGLFVVGDRKQSIYGFRGADVAVFSRVAAELAGEAAARALSLPATHASRAPSADFIALTESRRSGASIVSFVNELSRLDFASSQGDPPRDFEVAYGEAEHLRSFRGDVGDRVLFVHDDGAPPPAGEPLLDGGDPTLREAFVAAAFASHASGALGFALRDVAILARRRSTIPLIELALGRFGVPYVVAGRALYEASEVRDLAATLRLVLDPRDRHALATVLRGPLVGLSDAALLALTEERRGLCRDVLAPAPESDRARLDPRAFPEEGARLRDFRARFIALREPVLRLAPGEALGALLRGLDLDRIVAALPRAAARLGNVDRVVALAREKGGTLLGFSRWLDRQIADETDEAEAAVFSEEDDAVRLTTIHASKGLDFEAVVLVDLDSAPRPRYTPLSYDRDAGGRARFVVQHKGARGVPLPSRVWDEANEERKARELAERKRLTYVAVTRAKRLLALVGRTDGARQGSALETLLAGREGGVFSGLGEVDASGLLREAIEGASGSPSEAAEPTRAPPPKPSTPRVDRLPIATTPLGVFRGCARRFRLRFLLGLDEPVASGQLDLFESQPLRADERPERPPSDDGPDPRVLGRAAHRVLELWPRDAWGRDADPSVIEDALVTEGLPRDEAHALAQHLARILVGPYARRIADPRCVIHREEELSWESLGAPALSLRGTLDLFVEHEGGLVDVVDYKLARPSKTLDRYAFQLRAYALALSRARPDASVRAGILFLEGSDEPVWLEGAGPDGALSAAEHDAFAEELADLARRLAAARTTGVFPPVEIAACRALGCGFITACHKPEAHRGAARQRR